MDSYAEALFESICLCGQWYAEEDARAAVCVADVYDQLNEIPSERAVHFIAGLRALDLYIARKAGSTGDMVTQWMKADMMAGSCP
jgi:hypothetical protein